MSAADERKSIGDLFKAEWADRLPVAWPNMKFEPPAEAAWCRFSIVQAEARQIEIGGINNEARAEGRVFVQVFVPVGTGDKVARQHCDVAANIFKTHKTLTTPEGCVRFRRPVIRDIGAAGAHYQFNVAIPYLYDTL